VSESNPPGLFGDDTTGPGYVVLARKYRPKTFEDLIGQEAMVRTIANSFALGRIPHATMLTGVRGCRQDDDSAAAGAGAQLQARRH
jgi:DNA polymerase-3 subunit gamma/tau